MAALERYIYWRLTAELTCPRCEQYTPDGWCPMCGDQYPWPKRDQTHQPAKPLGIRGTARTPR